MIDHNNLEEFADPHTYDIEDTSDTGIAFYKGKESFFFPYALLESMRFQGGKITLSFAPAMVVVEGRGLHRIYALLAAQKISRLVEQGERHEEAFETTLYVRRIDEIPKAKSGKDGET